MTTLDPTMGMRRSQLYRRHINNNAVFKKTGSDFVVSHYDNGNNQRTELDQARSMAICDLSTLSRTGFKGAGAPIWAESQGVKLPDRANRAIVQPDGCLVAKLSDQELLILSDILAKSHQVTALGEQSTSDHLENDTQTYLLPRGDSHCWLAVTGNQAAEMFSKVCGVDLRSHKFALGNIAQTSVAKTNAIVIRQDLGQTLSYFILCDISATEFLWDCLLDAMQEYAGSPVGIRALEQLVASQ
ncbi:MAG TPA: sarcosine oxidase [Porticoccaceae bacterium]|nr:sarcosine oxidase [Porticoccaceae bacterium]